jgi:uncharacterized membrane protein YdjX (TVP38/TMEM64 family)
LPDIDRSSARGSRKPFYARRRLWALLLYAAFLIAAWVMKLNEITSVDDLFALRDRHFVLILSGFIAFYAVSVVAMIPTLPLNLASGVIWGGLPGGIICTCATMVGACISFLIARVFSERYGLFVGERKHPLWRRVEQVLERNQVAAVAFVRLNPIFPTGVFNYLFGLTHIGFRKYAIYSGLFLLPPSVAVAFIGEASGGMALESAKDPILAMTIILGAVCAMILLYLVFRERNMPAEPAEKE